MSSVAKLPDMTPSRRWLAALEMSARVDREPHRLLADVVNEWALIQPGAPAIIAPEEKLTYESLAARINRYARWAEQQNLGVGHSVALMLSTCSDYLAIWCGITSTGATVALINTQLKGDALAHVLALVKAEVVIASPEHHAIAYQCAGESKVISLQDLKDAASLLPGEPIPLQERPAVSTGNTALLIYTSGTTGLPKAARVSHARVMGWGHWFAGLMAASPEDRLYNCLPLFHSVGGVVAMSSMLVAGGSVVTPARFSASRFWQDVSTHQCTIFQYIGELCRYLASAPPQASEKNHALRLAVGNGLNGNVWQQFQDRFGIPHILEFYAATEGSFSLFNVEGKPGSIGRIPSFMAHRFPAMIAEFDPDRELPVRGPDGFCIKVKRGKTGEALGKISGTAAGRFEGYTSDTESDRKVLRDVLQKGDLWFRTGDLMRQDDEGYWYFVDRIGDTFRWKGENVSSAEVASIISAVPAILDAVVFGVQVPGHEGRAGMAAVVPGSGFEPQQLFNAVESGLPAYARPLFIRLCSGLSATATFKLQKQNVAQLAYEPAHGEVLIHDKAALNYLPLTQERLAEIRSGKARL